MGCKTSARYHVFWAWWKIMCQKTRWSHPAPKWRPQCMGHLSSMVECFNPSMLLILFCSNLATNQQLYLHRNWFLLLRQHPTNSARPPRFHRAQLSIPVCPKMHKICFLSLAMDAWLFLLHHIHICSLLMLHLNPALIINTTPEMSQAQIQLKI